MESFSHADDLLSQAKNDEFEDSYLLLDRESELLLVVITTSKVEDLLTEPWSPATCEAMLDKRCKHVSTTHLR